MDFSYAHLRKYFLLTEESHHSFIESNPKPGRIKGFPTLDYEGEEFVVSPILEL
jgi:hypothetical protein